MSTWQEIECSPDTDLTSRSQETPRKETWNNKTVPLCPIFLISMFDGPRCYVSDFWHTFVDFTIGSVYCGSCTMANGCLANWTITRSYHENYTIGWIVLSWKLHDSILLSYKWHNWKFLSSKGMRGFCYLTSSQCYQQHIDNTC